MRESTFGRRSLLLLAATGLTGAATLWLMDPRVGRLWLNTMGLAASAAFGALVLGGLAAIIAYKTDAPGRKTARLLFVGMLFVPLYLVAGAWDAGFGLQGWHTLLRIGTSGGEPWLSGWRAAVWVHALAAVPWVVLIVGAALRAIEAEIEEDAATCASPARVLLHVTLPRIAPALVLAALWVTVAAATEISVTDFFQVRTFAEEVYTQAALGTFDFGQADEAGGSLPALRASGLWIGLLLSAILAVAAIAVAGRLLTGYADGSDRPPWIARLGRVRWLAAGLLWCILLMAAGIPLANLMYKAGANVTLTGAHFVRSWSPAKVAERITAAPHEFRGDLWLSARLGAAAATAAVAIALPLAWTLRNARRTPWLRLAIPALCLTVPGPLLGVGIIHALNRPTDSLLSPLAWLYDTNFAPWLAQTIRALPLAVLILWPALASVPQATLDAAATEGSGSVGRLLRIGLPQRLPAVAAAWLVGLAIALGELAATVLVVPPQPATPISVRIFQLLHYGVDDRVAAISLVMAAAIGVLTWISVTLLKRVALRDAVVTPSRSHMPDLE